MKVKNNMLSGVINNVKSVVENAKKIAIVKDYNDYRVAVSNAKNAISDANKKLYKQHPVAYTIASVASFIGAVYASNPEFWDETISEGINTIKHKVSEKSKSRNDLYIERSNKISNTMDSLNDFNETIEKEDLCRYVINDTANWFSTIDLGSYRVELRRLDKNQLVDEIKLLDSLITYYKRTEFYDDDEVDNLLTKFNTFHKYASERLVEVVCNQNK